MTPLSATPAARPLDPLRRVLRTVSVLVSVIGYAVLAPMGYVPFALLCWCWRKRPLHRARRLQTYIRRGFRFTLWWLRLVRIADSRYREAMPDIPKGPCIVIANHPTQLDVLAVNACLGKSTTIVKPSVFNRRLIRPFLVGAGLLEGPGRDPISIGRVIEDGVQRLRDGMQIYVFPEGSRSLSDRLRPFGRVAFEIACRADVPIVVLGVKCEPKYLSPDVSIFRPPARLAVHQMQVLGIEHPCDHEHNSRRMCAAVERQLGEWVFGDGEAARDAVAQRATADHVLTS